MAFGLVRNAFFLANQLKEAKDDLKDDLGGRINDLQGDIKDVKHDVRSLIVRQSEMERYVMTVAENLVKNCGGKKQEVVVLCFALLLQPYTRATHRYRRDSGQDTV